MLTINRKEITVVIGNEQTLVRNPETGMIEVKDNTPVKNFAEQIKDWYENYTEVNVISGEWLIKVRKDGIALTAPDGFDRFPLYYGQYLKVNVDWEDADKVDIYFDARDMAQDIFEIVEED